MGLLAAYAWSDSEVMVILQASPYFADVEDYLYDSPDTTYNETVNYESSYLKAISDDLYLETEGDPFGYYIDGVSGGLDKAPETYGDPIALNKVSGISSTECSFSESEIAEKSSAHGFTFDLTVKFGFNAGFVESNAGAYVSLQYMNGYTTTTTNGKGTAFAGTVMGLNGTAMKKDGLNPDAWGFNWKLGKWDSNIQNSKATVPVIGYVLSDVKAPPFPVNDLEIAYTQAAGDTGVTFDLTWEKGDKDGSVRPETVGYKVYLYDPSDKEYKLLETICDVDTCSYQYTGNADGRVQTFTVTNGVEIASIEMDENGNFIFTLTDGSKMNVGKVESTDSIPASASTGENSLDEMQMRLDKLEKQAEKKAVRDKLVYVALALSILSLLWNATTLITEFMKKKR